MDGESGGGASALHVPQLKSYTHIDAPSHAAGEVSASHSSRLSRLDHADGASVTRFTRPARAPLLLNDVERRKIRSSGKQLA